MRRPTCLACATSLFAALLLIGCATAPRVVPPGISLVNALTFDNALSGKRDGLRSAWPLAQVAQSTEQFPLAQLKRCKAGAARCSWGVLRSARTFGKVRVLPSGVALEVEVVVDVERSQRAHGGAQNAAMTIPADVDALVLQRTVRRELMLEYGKVQRIDFDHGISYALCAQRLDAARQPLENCPIDYI